MSESPETYRVIDLCYDKERNGELAGDITTYNGFEAKKIIAETEDITSDEV